MAPDLSGSFLKSVSNHRWDNRFRCLSALEYLVRKSLSIWFIKTYKSWFQCPVQCLIESVCLCVHVHVLRVFQFVSLTYLITSPNNLASSCSTYFSLTTQLCYQEMHTKLVVLTGDYLIQFLSGRDTAYIYTSPMTRYTCICIQRGIILLHTRQWQQRMLSRR